MSIYIRAAEALGFTSLSAIATAAGINVGTWSHIYNGTRLLNDQLANKLIEAIRFQNGWSYKEAAYQLVAVITLMQEQLTHVNGRHSGKLTSCDVKRWLYSYRKRMERSESRLPEPLNPDDQNLSVNEQLRKILDYLKEWGMKHDYGYVDKVQRAFHDEYSDFILPTIRQGMRRDDCYELVKQIYNHIRYIAHLCHEFDFVVEMSTWFIQQSKHNGDKHVKVNALTTYAWELSSQNTRNSLEKAQNCVREAWLIASSNAFLEQITPEGMDVLALLTELRLRLTIRLSQNREASVKATNFEKVLDGSKELLKKPKSWQKLSSRLKERYGLALDYQHAVYLYHQEEYNQSQLIFRHIKDRTNLMGWIRVEQAALSWIVSILKATGNRDELAKILPPVVKVPDCLPHRKVIFDDALVWMGGEGTV